MITQWPFLFFNPEKSVSISLELVVFASSGRDDCCWW